MATLVAADRTRSAGERERHARDGAGEWWQATQGADPHALVADWLQAGLLPLAAAAPAV